MWRGTQSTQRGYVKGVRGGGTWRGYAEGVRGGGKRRGYVERYAEGYAEYAEGVR